MAEGKRVILVKLTADDGTVGWGEAGPSRRWSYETLETAESSIRDYFIPVLLGHDLEDIEGAHMAAGVEKFEQLVEAKGLDAAF